MSSNGNRNKHSTRHSLVACFFLLLLASSLLGISPAQPQGVQAALETPTAQPQGVQAAPDTPPAFSATFAKLGYANRTLESPHSTTEYSLRLPEGWKLRAGSFVELDYSYTYTRVYTRVGALETEAIPSLFGEIIITVDGQTPQVSPIKEATLEHSLRVELPLATFNDPALRTHNIKVTLDESPLCSVPHKASLTIHSGSMFSLNYDQLSIVTDLALYPRPFYQGAFEPDQIRFVLPAQLTETDLNGAVVVATKLGNLAPRMVISGTTDQELLGRLDVRDAISHEHLIVIGKPETNEVILRLNDLGALSLPLRERQLSLSSEGPVTVVSGDSLTYTLTLTNTTQKAASDLVLVDTLPSGSQMESCSPTCSKTSEEEIKWAIPPLAADEAASFTLVLRASEAAPSSVLENTVTLFDAASDLLNMSTLTTTLSSTLSSANHSSFSPSRYLFMQGTRAVAENDGVVQELVSPWDQTRAILVITGLSDQAVSRASRAMGLDNYFPGMQGPWALVRDVRPLSDLQPKSPITDTTFADLGYEDSVLRGYFEETSYSVNIPLDWSLTEEAYLDLRFSHSARLLNSASSVNVLFNDKPIAAAPLTDENALNGRLKIKLPASQARPRASNRITIQAELRPLDACADTDLWLSISNASLLHLDHQVQNVRALDLGFYPRPFNQRPDLTDVMFALPAEPMVAEWEDALRLAAALGTASNGSAFAPPVVLGNNWTKETLEDYHFIAIGRPSRNSLLQQVNAQLPQPFLIHSDSIEQKIDQATLRLAPDVSLGYIQLIVSPWNKARALLAITGTTDKGAREAMDILLYQPGQLKGNLALVRDNQVKTIDTRGLTRAGVAAALATAVPQMTPAPNVSSVSTPLSPGLTPSAPAPRISGAPGRPAWLVPLVGATGLVTLVILFIAFWQARRGRL
jgi:uncharacterized repeat protein (TIGR01451 family)